MLLLVIAAIVLEAIAQAWIEWKRLLWGQLGMAIREKVIVMRPAPAAANRGAVVAADQPSIANRIIKSIVKTVSIDESAGSSVEESYLGVRWPVIAIGVGVMALAIMLVVLPDIFVPDTSLGWVDTWYYVSLALKLPERVAEHRFLYQSERIGWTLPVYVFNRLATPLVANYLAKSLFFIAGLFFLFGSVKETTGSVRTATFVSAVAAFHSFLVHSIGTSYVDGAMNTYILGFLYFSTLAYSRRGSAWNGFLAGAFFGAQLLTHLVALVLIPSLALYGILTWVRTVGRRPRIGRVTLQLTAGVVTVLAFAFALYGHWGIGTFPLNVSLAMLFSHSPNEWVRPTSGAWLLHASWLLLPAVVLFWTLATIGRGLDRASHWSAVAHPVYVVFIAVSGTFTALYALNEPWLMFPFYASYLLPFTFVALGRIAVIYVEVLRPPTYWRVVAASFLLGGLGYALAPWINAGLALVVALGCLVAATSLRLQGGWATTAAFPVLLMGAGMSINCASADYTSQLRYAFSATAMQTVYPAKSAAGALKIPRAKRFQAAIAAADRLTVDLSGNSGRQYFFWYDGRDELGMFFRSVTSLMFAWSTGHLLGEDFHDFDQENLDRLAAYSETGMRDLVVLTRSPEIMPPDPRFTIKWTDREQVGGITYFAHYVAFEPVLAQVQ